MKAPNKADLLKEELKMLNSLLPACAYIPFNDLKARNCAILHIPITEARVFTTKERAPFKICIEIFQPYEELNNIESDPDSLSVRSQRSMSMPSAKRGSKLYNLIEEIKEEPQEEFVEMIRAMRKATETKKAKIKSKKEVVVSRAPALSTPNLHYERLSLFGQTNSGDLGAVYGGDEEEDGGEIDERPVLFFKETFKDQSLRLRSKSPFGKLKTWALLNVIVKSGDDLRQEQLAMQLISFFQQVFKSKKLSLWLYPYDIIATGNECGVLECVPNATSIDGLKKDLPVDKKTLYDFFCMQFGQETNKKFKKARREFMKSLAGYSLLCYILQIKDRHNGNILIDSKGHLIHIDFGFMFSNSPGGNMNFEKAPFKLTDEFERILGGRRSKLFIEFRSLCVKGYTALKEHAEQIILLVEMMRIGSGANLSCFIGGEVVTKALRERLLPRNRMSEGDSKEYINLLIDDSLDNWTTRCYDRFQYCCQNIFY